MPKSTMTKTEYYQRIETKLLNAMREIDDAVGLMNQLYHENHKEADQTLGAKNTLKKVLNSKFDKCARDVARKQKVK